MRRILALLLKICHTLYTYSLVGLVFSSSLTVRSMFSLWYNYRYNRTFYCLGNLFCYCGHDVAFVFYLAFFIVQWPKIWALFKICFCLVFSLYSGPRSGRNVVFWFLYCLVFSKYSGPRSGHGVGSVLPDIRLGWLGHCWAHSPGL